MYILDVSFFAKNMQKTCRKKKQQSTCIPKPKSNCCAVLLKFKAPQAFRSGLVAMLAILSADNGDMVNAYFPTFGGFHGKFTYMNIPVPCMDPMSL